MTCTVEERREPIAAADAIRLTTTTCPVGLDRLTWPRPEPAAEGPGPGLAEVVTTTDSTASHADGVAATARSAITKATSSAQRR